MVNLPVLDFQCSLVLGNHLLFLIPHTTLAFPALLCLLPLQNYLAINHISEVSGIQLNVLNVFDSLNADKDLVVLFQELIKLHIHMFLFHTMEHPVFCLSNLFQNPYLSEQRAFVF